MTERKKTLRKATQGEKKPKAEGRDRAPHSRERSSSGRAREEKSRGGTSTQEEKENYGFQKKMKMLSAKLHQNIARRTPPPPPRAKKRAKHTPKGKGKKKGGPQKADLRRGAAEGREDKAAQSTVFSLSSTGGLRQKQKPNKKKEAEWDRKRRRKKCRGEMNWEHFKNGGAED